MSPFDEGDDSSTDEMVLPMGPAESLLRASHALERRGDRLLGPLVRAGVPLAAGRRSVERAAELLDAAARSASRPALDPSGAMVRRRPVGPVFAAPGDATLTTACAQLGAALATGCPCTLVVPPGDAAVMEALLGILAEEGIDADRVALETSEDVDARLSDARDGGATVLTRARGATAAFLVLPHADLERAMTAIVETTLIDPSRSAWAHNRVLVPAGAAQDFAFELQRRLSSLPTGNADDTVTRVPRLPEERAARLRTLLDGTALAGGLQLGGGVGRGGVVDPAVVLDVDPQDRLVTTASLGPVVPVLPYGSTGHGVALANLGGPTDVAWLDGSHLTDTIRVAELLHARTVVVNSPLLPAADQIAVPLAECGHLQTIRLTW